MTVCNKIANLIGHNFVLPLLAKKQIK